MASSRQTAREIAAILMRHVSQERIQCIVADLKEVEGNKSVIESIKRIIAELEYLGFQQ